jgi:spoIIIJ-associated protein
MEWVETTGRTVEEAKDTALDQLGVDEHDAEFEILEEPKFGLFGRLRSEARVRARVRPTTPRAKDDRRDRRRRRKDSPADASAPVGAGRSLHDIDTDETPGGDLGPATDESVASNLPRPAASRAGGGSSSPGTARSGPRRPQRGDRKRSRPAEDAGSATNMGPAGSGQNEEQSLGTDRSGGDEGAGMSVSLDEQGEVAKEFLGGLVGEMALQAEIDISRPDEDTVELNLSGQDLGLLIGPKGATLLALQDLTRTVVQRRTSAVNGRLTVDVGGYRKKRKEALERFTRQLAAEVKASGARKALEPMNAADRKIVHDTVNELDGVTTTSEGEEPRRRVVILPSGS